MSGKAQDAAIQALCALCSVQGSQREPLSFLLLTPVPGPNWSKFHMAGRAPPTGPSDAISQVLFGSITAKGSYQNWTQCSRMG